MRRACVHACVVHLHILSHVATVTSLHIAAPASATTAVVSPPVSYKPYDVGHAIHHVPNDVNTSVGCERYRAIRIRVDPSN